MRCYIGGISVDLQYQSGSIVIVWKQDAATAGHSQVEGI